MKKLQFFILTFLSLQLCFSQTSPPQTISYQGIARDASGNILSVQPIGIQFIIHQGSMSGNPVFTETHATTTNSLGLFTLEIGKNNPTQFQSIDWSNGPYFLEVQMDPTGGTSYTYVGTQQLLSVPYALYAKNSYSANTSYNSSYALGSYSTANAPPFTFTSSSTSTGATFTLTQGSNTATTSISFPPTPPTTVSMFSSGIASVTPSSGNAFTVHVDAPSLNVINGSSQATISVSQGTATSTKTLSFPASNITITPSGIAAISPTTGNNFNLSVPAPSLSATSNTTGIITLTINQGSASDTAMIDIKNNAWALFGNSGTNPPTSFLGTTDAKDLVFKTSNLERMRIASNGNIGIGVLTPTNPLHIVSSGTVPNIFSYNNSTGEAGFFYLDNNANTNNAVHAVNNGNGRAGDFEINISTNSKEAFLARTIGTGQAGRFEVANPFNNQPALFAITNGTTTGSMAFKAVGNGTTTAVFEQGNVGIGTLSPTSLLSVAGDVDIPATNAYKYTSPKTYTMSISPFAFHEESPACSYTAVTGNIGPVPGGTIALISGFACYYDAPLILPSNCTITAIYAYVYDNSTYSITCQLWRNDFSTSTAYGNATNLATLSSGTSPTIQELSLTALNILYAPSTHAYYFRVRLPYDPGNIRLGKILVVYQKLETD